MKYEKGQGESESTSWGGVAKWYGEHLEGDDTYHAKVVAPNLLRIVSPGEGMSILDIGCGEGYFSRLFAKTGASVHGADISPELIAQAKEKGGGAIYHVARGEKLPFAAGASFNVVTAVLTLQNMERIEPVLKEAARVLVPGGRFICVLNHPAFRIPKKSSWGWDDDEKVQYRRVDAYLSAHKEHIDMTPGRKVGKVYTHSFHRSLQDYSKALFGAGFAISRFEEWVSHRKSGEGPRRGAEDTARKEIPLFLMIEAKI